jgi:hypothetical protein
MSPWTALNPDEGLTLVPGAFYAVVASVKSSHTQADLQAFAQKRGLVLLDYAEQGQRVGLGPDPRSPGYKYVAAIARATDAGSIPGSVPWPASMFDSSALVSAWSAPAGSAPATAPPAPLPPPAPVSPLPPPFGPAVAWWRSL